MRSSVSAPRKCENIQDLGIRLKWIDSILHGYDSVFQLEPLDLGLLYQLILRYATQI